MEDRLTNLKNTFSEIMDYKDKNIQSMLLLESRIKKIKELYDEFLRVNRETLFVFSLDAFHFQSKIIDIEFEDVTRLYYAITNRMYCDYYKLFKIIVEYVNENITDKKLLELVQVNDNFPVYKDLEPFKQYDFHFIQTLHEVILVIIHSLNTIMNKKEHELELYQNKNKIGLNIDNFVNTHIFNNTIMREKIGLFVSYIEFFHKLHTKYFKRFTMKLNLMLQQVNNDIKLDNYEMSDKKDMLSDFKGEISKEVYNELKISVCDDSSISNSDSGSDTPESVRSIPLKTPPNTPFVSSNNLLLDVSACEVDNNVVDKSEVVNDISGGLVVDASACEVVNDISGGLVVDASACEVVNDASTCEVVVNDASTCEVVNDVSGGVVDK